MKALSGEKFKKRLHPSPKFSILSVIIKSSVICSALSTGLVYGDDRRIQKVVSYSEQRIEIIGLRLDGQITERRIRTYPFDDENARCCGSGVCTASRSSPQSTPRFTIYSTRKGQYQLAVQILITLNLNYTLGGARLLPASPLERHNAIASAAAVSLLPVQ